MKIMIADKLSANVVSDLEYLGAVVVVKKNLSIWQGG
jgi:hypothetical protein